MSCYIWLAGKPVSLTSWACSSAVCEQLRVLQVESWRRKEETTPALEETTAMSRIERCLCLVDRRRSRPNLFRNSSTKVIQLLILRSYLRHGLPLYILSLELFQAEQFSVDDNVSDVRHIWLRSDKCLWLIVSWERRILETGMQSRIEDGPLQHTKTCHFPIP